MPNTIPLAVFAIIGACLQVLVLAVQSFGANRNLPIITLSAWFLYLDISALINSVWWTSSDYTTWSSGAGWCDIDTVVFDSSSNGVLLALVGISYHLYYLSRPTARRLTTHKIFVWKIADIALLFVIPICYICIHPFLTNYRYGVIQYVGCSSVMVGTSSANIAFAVIIPLLLIVLLLVLNGLTLVYFIMRGKESVYQALRFKERYSVNFYVRTMVCSLCAIFVCVPLVLYNVASILSQVQTIAPIPWAHGKPENWGQIGSATWADILDTPNASVFMATLASRSCIIALSFVCFFCFGTGDTAVVFYRRALSKCGILSTVECPSLESTRLSSTNKSFDDSKLKNTQVSVHVAPCSGSPTREHCS